MSASQLHDAGFIGYDFLEGCVIEQELTNCLQDTSRVQRDLCDLSDESKSQEVILYTSIVYSIALLSVALRIAGKAVSKRLAWDDVMVVAALFLTAIPMGCVLDMVLKGFGEHLWNLEDGKLLPILRYCKLPFCNTSAVTLIGASIHLLVDVRHCTVYDQDLVGLVISRDLQDAQISDHRICLPRVLGHQQLDDVPHHHLRLQPSFLVLES